MIDKLLIHLGFKEDDSVELTASEKMMYSAGIVVGTAFLTNMIMK